MKAQPSLINLIRKTYYLEDEFIIFGSPGRKSNQRDVTSSGQYILGKQARFYVTLVERQLKRLKIKTDLNDRRLLWIFEIYYNNKSADASVELIFDIMQKNGVIKNDVTIRNYLVAAEELDKEVPRTKISIYKLKEYLK